MIAKLVLALKRFLCATPALDGLHSPERMRDILVRERMRVDRTGEQLSLIAYTPAASSGGADAGEEEIGEASLALLVPILKARLRGSDEIGFLDHVRIGVVLPGTSGTGAWKVAEDIGERFPAHLAAPLRQVYTYPSDTFTLPSGGTGEACPAREESREVLPLLLILARRMPLWKRCLDVCGSLLALILLAPLLLVLAVAIKWFSPGPVLFTQWRSGLGGKPFRICKFRTMVVDAEHKKADLRVLNERDGPAFKIKNDPRMTALGRFLRRTSLDELPQFWNVLMGHMSLVGPRPLPCDETAACDSWHQQRLEVTPGLTCIWQVRGRSHASFADWIRMDVQYIRSMSLSQDLKLLFLTIPAVLLCRGH